MLSKGEPHPPLGFIGLGAMGGAMCRRLLEAGYSVTCHDIDRARVEVFVNAGARSAGSSREVVEAR